MAPDGHVWHNMAPMWPRLHNNAPYCNIWPHRAPYGFISQNIVSYGVAVAHCIGFYRGTITGFSSHLFRARAHTPVLHHCSAGHATYTAASSTAAPSGRFAAIHAPTCAASRADSSAALRAGSMPCAAPGCRPIDSRCRVHERGGPHMPRKVGESARPAPPSRGPPSATRASAAMVAEVPCNLTPRLARY